MTGATASAVKKPRVKRGITRRGLLVGAGGLGLIVAGGAIGLREGRPSLIASMAGGEGSFGTVANPGSPMAWFEVSPDNVVTFFAPKYEMGQGIHSALAQMAAEELGMPWSRMRVKQATVAQGFAAASFSTAGSTSVSQLFKPVMQAAATARELLRAEAARQLGVAGDALTLRDGVFAAADGRTLTFGQVVAGKSDAWVAPQTPAALKPASNYSLVGKAVARLDVPDKLVGKPVYAMDASVPGMVFGAVARPPRYGATIASVDDTAALQHPGVIKVVVDQAANFAGVVAATRTKAREAVAKLRINWTGGSRIDNGALSQLLQTDWNSGVVIRKPAGSATGATATIEATYNTPPAAHAHLEPLCALAEVRSDEIEVWLPTQNEASEVGFIRAALPGNRKITVHALQMGGSFGRKGAQSAAGEAARLSAAVGKPVHVSWSRAEEMQHSVFRPPTRTLLRGSVNAAGRIQSVDQVTTSGDIIFPFLSFPGASLMKGAFGVDFGVLAGLFLPYDIPAYQVRSNRVDLPFITGPWRGVGLMPNVFALESFVDELAHAAKADPLEFRLNNLPQDASGSRFRAVLESVREKSDWRSPLPAGRARGVATCTSNGSVVAMVVEIAINNGAIVVERVTTSIDAGLVINPENAALQARGSIVMGLSSTLHERLTFVDGMAVQSGFDTYPLLTMGETPTRIDVHFVEGGTVPHGMGEPVIGPVPAAVANAVFVLAGKRLREIPLRL